MFLKFLKSLFHRHNWWEYQDETYYQYNKQNIDLALEKTPRKRLCAKCGRIQIRERFCLGLNPPKYVDDWIDVKKEK